MPEMSARAKELQRMQKGRKRIEALSYGFFNIAPDSDEEEEEETPRRSSAASKAERQQYDEPNDMSMADEV